jgi:hypothetical protein
MTTKTYNLHGEEPLPIGSPPPVPKPDPEEDFIRQLYGSKLQFDNKPLSEILLSASQKAQINPSLLLSSAIQEGMNYAVTRPDEVSEAYLNAGKTGLDTNAYPVDGFYNYGLDRFGDDYNRLKKYLPEGFDQRFKTFKAKNEKGEDITTAAFMSNEDALIAKSSFLKDAQSQIDQYSKRKKINIDDADKDYFVLAAYNGGIGNAKTMLDQYAKAKDRKKFISEGGTTKKEIHKNISGRLKRLPFLNQLISGTNM